LKCIGNVAVQVPLDRKGEFVTKVISKSKQYEEEIAKDLSLMYLAGISTRSLAMISRRLVGNYGDQSCRRGAFRGRRTVALRDLSQGQIKYIFVDGVNFHMRIDRNRELVPVLAAIGVTDSGHRLVLSLQSGDKESSSKRIFREPQGSLS
jgi:putative transposase